ncbi:MAG: methanogenesis marker 16 metalloprotein [Candidatus Lokiarchaeota archaeon]|nr:methanogenesis marker 16 metalloprotein [Candidatus Lokiarchaeota archaeon]
MIKKLYYHFILLWISYLIVKSCQVFSLSKKRTLSEINQKIKKGTAQIYTVQDLIEKFENNEKVSFEDVDVVTTATKALMSGIAGIFSFRLSPPKKVRKFTEVTINGISGFPGPCPNEFLGIVDVIIYGTAHSMTRDNYSGGILFRDLVEGKKVKITAKSVEGLELKKELTLNEMQFARMMGTRQAIKNYFAMINPSKESIETIFSVLPLEGNKSQLTFSGCGAMNPFQNDPNADVYGVGTKILVNGNVGYIFGPGTRNDKLKPNMQTIADFKGMKPEYMGAFHTSYGLENICSIAVPIPILNEKIYSNVMKSDHDVPLVVLNVLGRNKLGKISYGDVWNHNFKVTFDPKKCIDCEDCPVDGKCPTDAFHLKSGIDRKRCFNCGTCYFLCPEKAFNADLKTVTFEGKDIPVVLRQSDRHGAIKLANQLKDMILKGEFVLKEPTDKLEFYPKVF